MNTLSYAAISSAAPEASEISAVAVIVAVDTLKLSPLEALAAEHLCCKNRDSKLQRFWHTPSKTSNIDPF